MPPRLPRKVTRLCVASPWWERRGQGKPRLPAPCPKGWACRTRELDSLHWQANWTPTETDVMREKVASVVGGDAWVIDGNYSAVQPIILARADTLVWLDYPLRVNFARLVKRTTRRIISREPLWNDCRETLAVTFSRDSIFVWAWKTHAKNRAKYPRLAQSPECAHLEFVRLRSPKEADRWLAGVTPRP